MTRVAALGSRTRMIISYMQARTVRRVSQAWGQGPLNQMEVALEPGRGSARRLLRQIPGRAPIGSADHGARNDQSADPESPYNKRFNSYSMSRGRSRASRDETLERRVWTVKPYTTSLVETKSCGGCSSTVCASRPRCLPTFRSTSVPPTNKVARNHVTRVVSDFPALHS